MSNNSLLLTLHFELVVEDFARDQRAHIVELAHLLIQALLPVLQLDELVGLLGLNLRGALEFLVVCFNSITLPFPRLVVRSFLFFARLACN